MNLTFHIWGTETIWDVRQYVEVIKYNGGDSQFKTIYTSNGSEKTLGVINECYY